MAIDFIRRFERPPFDRSAAVASAETETVLPPAQEPQTDDAEPDEPILPPPAHIVKLFVSSPSYARSEAAQIGRVIGQINAVFGGSVRIDAIGQDGRSLTGSAEPTFAAVACDAVVALMRPRLPDDPRDADEAASSQRSGIAGILPAMAGRKADAGLPDIHIFRYTDSTLSPAGRAADDTDWEGRKAVFEDWFRAKGGTFLTSVDFSSPEEFGAGLDSALRGWLERQGFAAPEPAHIEQPETAVAAEKPLQSAATGLGVAEAESALETISAGDTTTGDDAPGNDSPGDDATPGMEAVDIGSFGGELPAPDIEEDFAAQVPTAERAVEEPADSVETELFVAEAPDIPAENLVLDSLEPDTGIEPGEPAVEAEGTATVAEAHAVPAGAEISDPGEVAPNIPDSGEAPALDSPTDPDARAPADLSEETAPSLEAGIIPPAEAEAPEAEREETQQPDEPSDKTTADTISGSASADVAEVDEPADAAEREIEQLPAPDQPATETPEPATEPDGAGISAAKAEDEAKADIGNDETAGRGEIIVPKVPATTDEEQEQPPDRKSAKSRRAERKKARRTGYGAPPPQIVEPPQIIAPVEIAEPGTMSDSADSVDAVVEPASLEPDIAAAEEAKTDRSPAQDIAAEIDAQPADQAEPVADATTTDADKPDIRSEVPADPAPPPIDETPDVTETATLAADAAALAAAFEEAKRQRALSDEKYRALEAKTNDAVGTALRLERESKARDDKKLARNHRITWAIFIGILVIMGIAAAVVGMQWRSAALNRDQAEKGLANATDQANSLLSELTRISHQQATAPDAGNSEVIEQARKLLGVLVTARSFDPAEQRKQADAQLASADAFQKQGKLPEAASAAIQAQRVFQTLLASEPDQPLWQNGLAQSDMKLGEILVAQNQSDDALADYRAALTIRQGLAAKDPENIERQRALAAIQQKVGDILLTKGQLDDGLKIYRDALAVRKSLASKEPGNIDAQRDLLEVSNTNGDLETAQNRFDDALALYRDAFAIADMLAKKFPSETKWARGLTLNDNKIGDIFLAKERFDDALAAYREGLVNMKALAEKEPANNEWQSLIATGDERIGDAFAAEGHGDSALTAYQDALAIVKALAAKDPNGIGWWRGISEIQLRIGSVLYDRGKIEEAIAAHRESLAVVKSLIEKQPDNPRWRRDLMLDDGKIGQLLLTQGKRSEALDLYREALAIAKEMSAKYPKDADWQASQGLIDSNIGPLLMDTGNRDEGLAAHRDGLEIAKTLAAKEPRSVDRQTNLVVAYYNLGEAGEDSISNFSQALAILKRLDAAGVLPADKKAMIGKIAEEIDHVSKRPGPVARPDKPEKSSALGVASKQF